MKIYVGGSSDELDRAIAAMAACREAGIIVTSTWVETVKAAGAGNPRDASHDQRALWARADLSEVKAANVFWHLVPAKGHGRGSYAELACAHDHGKLLIASGDYLQSIFCALAEEFPDDESALARVIALHKLSNIPVVGVERAH